MTIKLITHDRVAHADDTFAAAILRIAYGQVEVVRTRDPEILRASAGEPGVFMLDVGGRFDPERRLFDHHQPEGAGYRNKEASEWPYATAGLVWKYYGAQAVRAMHPTLNDFDVEEVVKHIDDTVLKYIDAVDCGVRLKNAGPSLSAVVACFNTTWFEAEEDVFPFVMELAQVLLTRFVKRFVGKIFARDRVRQAGVELDGRVLVLDGCIPWTNVVAEERPEVLFVVYPVSESGRVTQWQLRAAVNDDMSPRIRLPRNWGGLERHALARVCGEYEAVFCHRSLHLAGALSRQGAMSMADAAIREHNECAVLQAA